MSWRSPPRRRRPNWPRARAGGSWRRVRVPAVRGFPWPNRLSEAAAASATAAGSPEPWVRRQAQPVPAHAFETNRTPWGLLEVEIGCGILPSGHEVMVNKCLIFRQAALLTYQNARQIFDFGRSPAYKAALSHPNHPDESQENPHGRPFPIQEHHAPQGPAGCPEVEAVRQAGAGNHGRRQAGPARSGDEPAAARRHHRRAPGEHAEGQYRARDQEGDRRRQRELRRDPLRGLWPRRRRRHRRGADRQPQPRGLRHPLLLHQIRRQSRRNRLGLLHVRSHRHHRI